MNEIQKYLIDRMVECLRKNAGELISNRGVGIFYTHPIEPVALAESLVELESLIKKSTKNHKSNVKTQAIYKNENHC